LWNVPSGKSTAKVDHEVTSSRVPFGKEVKIAMEAC
jgi:hypothetical protein